MDAAAVVILVVVPIAILGLALWGFLAAGSEAG
jgi:hypothetical protein